MKRFLSKANTQLFRVTTMSLPKGEKLSWLQLASYYCPVYPVLTYKYTPADKVDLETSLQHIKEHLVEFDHIRVDDSRVKKYMETKNELAKTSVDELTYVPISHKHYILGKLAIETELFILNVALLDLPWYAATIMHLLPIYELLLRVGSSALTVDIDLRDLQEGCRKEKKKAQENALAQQQLQEFADEVQLEKQKRHKQKLDNDFGYFVCQPEKKHPKPEKN